MRAITFLGTGRYDQTEYVWGERSYLSQFSPAATCAFLKPDQLVVFATDEARAAHGPALAAAARTPTRFVPIPHGRNTAELWDIFKAVAESVEPDEQVAFDVTHGLRSFPLVGLLAAAFLQSAGRVKLEAVLYGAFDVRDQSVTPSRTPVFDLTPMLELLRWATATDRFKRFGDGRDLAALLRTSKDRAARAAKGDRTLLSRMAGLDSAAGTLETSSLALRLIRVNEAMQTTSEIPAALRRAQPALEAAAIQPFSLLAGDIETALGPLAFEQPDDVTRLPEVLLTQRRIIDWYVEKQQMVQAVTLAREWLVSWAMAYVGQADLRDKALRETVTQTLGSESIRWRDAADKSAFKPLWFGGVPQLTQALSLWNDLADTRNDMDHAGMRRQPLAAADLAKRVVSLCTQLGELRVPPITPGFVP